MRMSGRRRGVDVSKENRVKELWLRFWRVLYSVMSMTTYLIAIVGIVMSTYYVFVDYQLMRALMTGLLVVLMIQFNKVNP